MADEERDSRASLPQTTDLKAALVNTVTGMSWFKQITFGQIIVLAFMGGSFWLIYWLINTGIPNYEDRRAAASKILTDQNIAALKVVADQNQVTITAMAQSHTDAIKSINTTHEAVVTKIIARSESIDKARRDELVRTEAFLRELLGKPQQPAGSTKSKSEEAAP